jgi:hypothetical protein
VRNALVYSSRKSRLDDDADDVDGVLWSCVLLLGLS